MITQRDWTIRVIVEYIFTRWDPKKTMKIDKYANWNLWPETCNKLHFSSLFVTQERWKNIKLNQKLICFTRLCRTNDRLRMALFLVDSEALSCYLRNVLWMHVLTNEVTGIILPLIWSCACVRYMQTESVLVLKMCLNGVKHLFLSVRICKITY